MKLIEIKNKFLKKIIRIANRELDYFEEINFLPENNYPQYLVKNAQQILYEKYSRKDINNFPRIVCPYLLSILKIIYSNKSFNFLDYGANNIDNYSYLNSHLPKINYLYYDLPQKNQIINEIKKKNEIKNLFVINDLDLLRNNNLNFVFMGSVLQYIKNYKTVLRLIFKSNPEYIFISGNVFYEKKINESPEIYFRQLNVLPQQNFGMFFHFDSLKFFFEENGWGLLSVSEAKYDHFINYNKINKNVGSINMLDLIFKKLKD